MKKIIAVFVLCVFVFSGSAFAKSAKNDYEGKLGIGVNVIDKAASLRMWFGETLGLDATTSLMIQQNKTEFSLGGGLVISMAKVDDVNFNIIPLVELQTILSQYEDTYLDTSFVEHTGFTTTTVIGFLMGARLECEVFLSSISKNLSIASGVGAMIGIFNDATNYLDPDADDYSNSEVVFMALRDEALATLIIRYYF